MFDATFVSMYSSNIPAKLPEVDGKPQAASAL